MAGSIWRDEKCEDADTSYISCSIPDSIPGGNYTHTDLAIEATQNLHLSEDFLPLEPQLVDAILGIASDVFLWPLSFTFLAALDLFFLNLSVMFCLKGSYPQCLGFCTIGTFSKSCIACHLSILLLSVEFPNHC